MANSNVIIKSTDMPKDMQDEVVYITMEAMKRSETESGIADAMKTGLESKYGRNWHCITGKNFGSKVSHEAGAFIFFYIGNQAFQTYKFG